VEDQLAIEAVLLAGRCGVADEDQVGLVSCVREGFSEARNARRQSANLRVTVRSLERDQDENGVVGVDELGLLRACRAAAASARCVPRYRW
jgi:hypothetical protein